MDQVKITKAMQANLSKIVTECNEAGNFNTAQFAQNALQQVANLVIRCKADAEVAEDSFELADK